MLAELMNEDLKVHTCIKANISGTVVETFRRTFAQPMTQRGGATMPYKQHTSGPMIKDNIGKPVLHDAKIALQEENSVGTTEYWKPLLNFDSMVRREIQNLSKRWKPHVLELVSSALTGNILQGNALKTTPKCAKSIEKGKKRNYQEERLDIKYHQEKLHATLVAQHSSVSTFNCPKTAICASLNQLTPPSSSLPPRPPAPHSYN